VVYHRNVLCMLSKVDVEKRDTFQPGRCIFSMLDVDRCGLFLIYRRVAGWIYS
jgi:hypothetical protein